MLDWYAVLHVTRDAPEEVVRASYRALSQKWHPDRNLDDPTAVGRMMEINQAYGVLSDVHTRAEFDRAWTAMQQESAFGEHTSTGSHGRPTEPHPSTNSPSPDPYWTESHTIHRQFRVLFMLMVVFVLAVLWVLKTAGETQP